MNDFASRPAFGPAGAAVVGKVVYQGIRDDQTPNNEYLEIALDSRLSSTVNLNGYRIKYDVSLTNFLLPNGLALSASNPTVRVYTGSGTNTASAVYMGRSAGSISNLFNDCVRLFPPSGSQYRWDLGNGCPVPGPAPGLVNPVFPMERVLEYHAPFERPRLQ